MPDVWEPIEPLAEHRDSVEAALREHVERASVSGLPLYRMMQYQLKWVDRDGLVVPRAPAHRTLGSLCAEAASVSASTPGSPAAATSAGASSAGSAIELFHESVEVHEQMQTGEAGSDEFPAVWWVWGPAQAINVGDGLHALARLALLRLQDQGYSPESTLAAMSVLDDLALKYYEGQYIELTYQERIDITTAQYSTMVRSKQGAMLGGTLALGARVAGTDDATVQALWDLGASVGEAAQVRADVATLWDRSAKPEGRVLNKSKLHPVVHVLESGTLAQKREIGGIYFKRVMEATDVEHLAEVLANAGARERSEERIAELMTEVQSKIDQVSASAEGRARWATIVQGLIEGQR
jgi:geranylgeranyl diphosphate synthase type I